MNDEERSTGNRVFGRSAPCIGANRIKSVRSNGNLTMRTLLSLLMFFSLNFGSFDISRSRWGGETWKKIVNKAPLCATIDERIESFTLRATLPLMFHLDLLLSVQQNTFPHFENKAGECRYAFIDVKSIIHLKRNGINVICMKRVSLFSAKLLCFHHQHEQQRKLNRTKCQQHRAAIQFQRHRQHHVCILHTQCSGAAVLRQSPIFIIFNILMERWYAMNRDRLFAAWVTHACRHPFNFRISKTQRFALDAVRTFECEISMEIKPRNEFEKNV